MICPCCYLVSISNNGHMSTFEGKYKSKCRLIKIFAYAYSKGLITVYSISAFTTVIATQFQLSQLLLLNISKNKDNPKNFK